MCGLQNNVNGNNNQINQRATCEQAATTTPPPAGGITGYEVVSQGSFTFFEPGTFTTAVMSCPAGKRVLSGGYIVTSGNPNFLSVTQTGPTADGTGWRMGVAATGGPVSGEFYTICANATA
ncbi:hypothetical protein JCM4814A_93510 [Streptomyces phaeofaciens JCM 4814]|uniref:Uncharacterized protein n=1 Tax=Streptomyces phaeofaciens TaxID=68254 RepID=A0A918HK33_9ACTN|nr:hypothetical protein [Streptomyces phaeofaciens]GGT71483.1 hypothetical protein GCM10010226_56850 [Streptomyces phaeofaciens]